MTETIRVAWAANADVRQVAYWLAALFGALILFQLVGLAFLAARSAFERHRQHRETRFAQAHGFQNVAEPGGAPLYFDGRRYLWAERDCLESFGVDTRNGRARLVGPKLGGPRRWHSQYAKEPHATITFRTLEDAIDGAAGAAQSPRRRAS